MRKLKNGKRRERYAAKQGTAKKTSAKEVASRAARLVGPKINKN
jgi:hypothetical protein